MPPEDGGDGSQHGSQQQLHSGTEDRPPMQSGPAQGAAGPSTVPLPDLDLIAAVKADAAEMDALRKKLALLREHQQSVDKMMAEVMKVSQKRAVDNALGPPRTTGTVMSQIYNYMREVAQRFGHCYGSVAAVPNLPAEVLAELRVHIAFVATLMGGLAALDMWGAHESIAVQLEALAQYCAKVAGEGKKGPADPGGDAATALANARPNQAACQAALEFVARLHKRPAGSAARSTAGGGGTSGTWLKRPASGREDRPRESSSSRTAEYKRSKR